MIEPNLATMLAFLTTDALVHPALLETALREAADTTFNAITVDGETSTNDSVFLLASGSSRVAIDQSSYPVLAEALRDVSRRLAIAIVRGGEGATKLVTVRVTGGRSREECYVAARTIANSPLVKTAIHGGDPNWGRLLAAAGRADVGIDLTRAKVAIGGTVLFCDGRPHDDAAPHASVHLRGHDVDVHVDLGCGTAHEAVIWTCDLSPEYVRINAEYRS
jgi:glutamate N-acetyltransferase/amino-acid N-acetyltransferase